MLISKPHAQNPLSVPKKHHKSMRLQASTDILPCLTHTSTHIHKEHGHVIHTCTKGLLVCPGCGLLSLHLQASMIQIMKHIVRETATTDCLTDFPMQVTLSHSCTCKAQHMNAMHTAVPHALLTFWRLTSPASTYTAGFRSATGMDMQQLPRSNAARQALHAECYRPTTAGWELSSLAQGLRTSDHMNSPDILTAIRNE